MLSLDLRRIKTPHERFEQTYAPSQLGAHLRAERSGGQAGEDFTIAESIALAFDIFKDNDQFRLVGDVRTTLELSCSRCLETFPMLLDQHFDLRYQPHARNTGEGEREVEEDDLTTAFYENDEIDLGQLMREQCYLALPMKPLCREDCRGLCPVCGTNLNRGTCLCSMRWEDPRLAALKAWRNKS